MTRRFYPAVLERGEKGTYALWFPDFPGLVAAARSQEEALSKAEHALAQAVVKLSERGKPLPEPTPFEKIELPKDCKPVTLLALSVDPPHASERVNIYLPRKLLQRVDERATDLGMSRSSFFGWAANLALGVYGPKSIVMPQEFLTKGRAPPQPAASKRRSKA